MKRKRAGAPLTLQHFLDRSNFSEETRCWVWKMARGHNGYGMIRSGGRNHNAHRLAYETANNVKVPRNIDVCHTCDNRLCVNPAHLFLGSRAVNVRDAIAKGRFKMPPRNEGGEKSPVAKLTEADVRAIRQDRRPQRIIAQDYGVHQATISMVIRRKNWGHV